MSFCHRCGTKLSSECLFCINCGAKVLTMEDIEREVSAPAPAANENDYTADTVIIVSEADKSSENSTAAPADDDIRITLDNSWEMYDDELDSEEFDRNSSTEDIKDDRNSDYDYLEDDDDIIIFTEAEESVPDTPALSPLCNTHPERNVFSSSQYRYLQGLKYWSYNGVLYYANSSNDEIWQIEDEKNILTRKIGLKKKLKRNEEIISMFVNETGIYVITVKYITRSGEEYSQFKMLRIGHDGEYKSGYSLGTTRRSFTAAYMNRDTLYFSINNKLVEYRFVSCSEYELVKRSSRSDFSISAVYASDNFVVFNDENYDKNDERYGWTLYNKNNDETTYLEKHFSIDPWKNEGLKIGFFDMQKELVWLYDKVAMTMQAYSLKTLAPADEKIWHFADMEWTSSGRLYFDGEVLYSAPAYYKMFAYNSEGGKFTWLDELHGCCEVFQVLNDRIHINTEGCYSPTLVYPKTAEKQNSLYKSPFDLSQ